jgi:hypothetical protein
MKIKAILTALLFAGAASADARLASPYPRKAVPPDESGYWIVISGNPWSHDAASGAEPDFSRVGWAFCPPFVAFRHEQDQNCIRQDAERGKRDTHPTRNLTVF